MHTVQIPTLGESISEGVIVRWIKAEGESVALDEPLLELETDKASVEIPSPATGVLHHQRAEGDTVQVGESVAEIDPDGVATTTSAKPEQHSQQQDSAPTDSARDDTAEPSRETAKSTPSEKTGATKPDSAPVTAKAAHDEPMALSPAVRRLVEENDLDPAAIKGSGRNGRITKADVLEYLQGDAAARPVAKTAIDSDREPRPPTPYPQGAADREPTEQDERKPMSRLRLRIAERLLQAQRDAAILTTFNEVDMSAVMSLRSRFKDEFESKHGVRLGFMSFFARACIAAMRDVPLVNARIEGSDVVQPRSVNLAVAVGTERGLVVPVVHDAERMSFAELEERIGRLADLAQRNKLSIADLSGGTFTISNGGVYGSLLSTPILNPPQSGILGMHKIEKRPVVVDDEVVVRPMMYLALSYDHRLIDGSEAVTFLVHVKERIETPERLLFDL